MFKIGDLVNNSYSHRQTEYGEVLGIVVAINLLPNYTNYKVFWTRLGEIYGWYSDSCLGLVI